MAPSPRNAAACERVPDAPRRRIAGLELDGRTPMATAINLCLLLFLTTAATLELPRTFLISARVSTSVGASISDVQVTVHVEKLMYDQDFTRIANGLKYDGFPRFLDELR